VKIITVRQVLLLHEYMIKKHGGSSGVRDMNMLQSAVNRPFATFDGQDLYPDIFLKSGALVQSIVKNHPFIDGNKRTGFSSAYLLLKKNSFQIDASQKQVVQFTVSVANENLSVDEIASWLKSHSTKI
jgi:death-on-curing protein